MSSKLNDSIEDLKRANSSKKPKECFGQRHVVSLLCFCGISLVYAMRVNLSVGIVAMVNHTATRSNETPQSVNATNVCPVDPVQSGSKNEDGEFVWSAGQQGMILSSFFWGYLITHIPGAILSQKYGGKWLFGVGILTTSIFTVLTPAAAYAGIQCLVAVRVLMGFGEILSKWIPPLERSVLCGFVYAGQALGTVFGLLISGQLARIALFGGWPSLFYFFGLVGFIWFVSWTYLITELPSDHPCISEEEKNYIMESLGMTPEGYAHVRHAHAPWKAIFTSKPAWALFLTQCCQNWGMNCLITELPSYMSSILHFNLSDNSLLSSLPYTCKFISTQIGGFTADFARTKGVWSTTGARKIMNTIGLSIPAICLIAASYSGCDRVLTVSLLTAAVGMNGFSYVGYAVNHIDLSPNYAGHLMAIANIFSTACGIGAPFVTGLLLDKGQNLDQWRIVFHIAAIVYLVGNLIFLLYGSGEQQPWNDPDYKKVQYSQNLKYGLTNPTFATEESYRRRSSEGEVTLFVKNVKEV